MNQKSSVHKKLVSIVSPVYNEKELIAEFIERLFKEINKHKNYSFEVILVDDRSSDNSLEIMKKYLSLDERIKIIELMRNYGQTSALCAGIDTAHGDIIITMDSDLQHFPEDIGLFLQKIEEGYDIVCGWRKHRREKIIRRWPSRIANYLIRKISKINLHDFGTTFRAYRKEQIKKIELFGEMHRFIPSLLNRLGCRITEIPIQNIARPAGKSSYGVRRTYGVALDIFFLFFYLNYLTRPLRIFGIFALILFVPGFAIAFTLTFMAYTGIIPNIREHGALLLLSVLLMILGVNFLCYGLIAEIQDRIYYAVRGEKIYNIRTIWQKRKYK